MSFTRVTVSVHVPMRLCAFVCVCMKLIFNHLVCMIEPPCLYDWCMCAFLYRLVCVCFLFTACIFMCCALCVFVCMYVYRILFICVCVYRCEGRALCLMYICVGIM